MYILLDGQIIKQSSIDLDIYSPFLHSGLGLKRTILYHDQQLLWFEEHLSRLKKESTKLKFELNPDHLAEEKILKLLDKNDLAHDTALVKILCIKDVLGCKTLVLTNPYLLPEYETKAALHSEPLFWHYNKLSTICEAEQIYWLEYYGDKFNTHQVLFINTKGRIISGFQSNIIAMWNDNLYYVYPGANYQPTIIQSKIIKHAYQLGIRKILSKSKGLSLELIQRADEILLISDTFIAQTITAIYRPSGSVINTSPKYKHDKSYSLLLRDFFLNNKN